MTDSEIKIILRDEVSNKVTRQTFRDTDCDGCSSCMQEGDDFIFLGSSSDKFCENCIDEILSFLAED